jgi:thioredoxin-related protein
MNNDVLSDPEVQAAVVRYFSPVRINTESDETIRYFEEQLSEREFAQAIGNQSLPTLYFMSAEGKVFANQPGALPKEIVLKLIHFVGSDAYLTTDFESYSMPD